MKLLFLMIGFVTAAMAQTVESRSVMLKGTSLPGTCTVGERFFKTDATAGQNLYLCTSANTWTQVSGGTGASYPTDLLCNATGGGTTTITLFDGASGTNTCNFAGGRFSAEATLAITGTPAAGTYCFETDGTTLYANLPGATTGLSASGITMNASATCFTAGRTPIGKSAYTSGSNWDATVEDWRPPFSLSLNPVAGTLMSSSDSGGNRTLNVDAQNLSDNSACRSTTGNDTFTCGTTPATTAYKRDRCYVLDADTANTGAATVNIDSLGAKSILRRNGDALSDGDITADKPISICYDGTQFIIQGDGGGSAASTYTGNYFSMPMLLDESHSTYVTVGTTPRIYHINVPFPTNISRFSFFIDANPGDSLGTGCTGSVCGITFGLYSAGCGTKLAETVPYTSSTGSGWQSATLASPYAAPAGVYCLMFATDSGALQISVPASTGGTIVSGANQGTARQGTCSSDGTTGNGTTLALPSSCGTISAGTTQFNIRIASN